MVGRSHTDALGSGDHGVKRAGNHSSQPRDRKTGRVQVLEIYESSQYLIVQGRNGEQEYRARELRVERAAILSM